MEIAEILKTLPHSPGVYVFLNTDGEVIYVGKAKDLKNRVSQYFHSPKNKNRKTLVMVSKIAAIQHTVVGSEADAFLLENNMIKQYQPRYNILLKDDKTYPWICIKNEAFPRVIITRKYKRDGSRYFGPYSSAAHARHLLDLVNSLYKLRTCKLQLSDANINAGKYKVCLEYHIKRCDAPCTGGISKREYDRNIDNVIDILKGNSYTLIKKFEQCMKKAAEELRFEEAQEYKEKLEILQRHYQKSLIVNTSNLNVDVFNIVFDANDAFGNFMRVVGGCIVQSLSLSMKMQIEEDESRVLSTFILAIYDKLAEYGDKDKPLQIVVPFMPDIPDGYNDVKFVVPIRGDKSALLELSRKNAAAMKFEQLKREEVADRDEYADRVLENLRKDLEMEETPRHIECFDNSNIQGTNPVAACVVFKDAVPSKKDYRHFNIKTVVGANDFASMKEVVYRRYSRLLAEDGELPQLIVIDGGKGQVSSALEALDELGLRGKIKLIGIAERMEELIVPGDPYPLFLDRNSTSLRIIMQLRDEAHRFGITHHRNRRSSSQLVSELDSIPGVGAVSREKLIIKYHTISNIKKAPYREIVNVIGKAPANSLFTYFGLDIPQY